MYTGKASEVSIKTANSGAVLDCERRQMCIGDQIAGRTDRSDQTTEHSRVARRRVHDNCGASRQPGFDQIESSARVKRNREQRRKRCQAHKCQ